MAGNIIPAIATTNAIIAGMIVTESLKLLSGNADSCAAVHRFLFTSTHWIDSDENVLSVQNWLLKKPSRKRLLMCTPMEPPSASCFVCGAHFVTLRVDTATFTLTDLVERVLIGRLGFNEPNIDTGSRYDWEVKGNLVKLSGKSG
jgi:ubiquitin-like 1-activating enzyme E1 B